MNRKVINHVGNIVKHLEFDSAFNREIKSHPKVIMDFATNAFDRTVVAIHLVEPGVKSIIDLGEHMTGHEVVNVKANSVLFLFNSFVCNARVVRVKDVQFRFKVSTELLILDSSSV